ncbi:MAG TPA: hypothetical protein VL500_03395 [Candidatus Eisenbacteria bacterium]|jgi:hypothetical protein|nr:hypothetical protein [Candidatus Eisenbacteria bacterium]
MGKFTKMALVLLYLLQLVVVFREQLVHMYRTAVSSVHHQTDHVANPHAGLRAMLERVVMITRPATKEALIAALGGSAAVLNSPQEDEVEHPAHDEDDKKDRAKRQKHAALRQYLIENLWHRIRRDVPAPSSLGARAAEMLSMIMSMRTPAPAAKA